LFGAVGGVFCADGANTGTDTIFGQPHRRGGAGVVPDSPVRRNGVTDTIFDVRRNGRERSTSNVQISTFNGVTERVHAGPNMGTDTLFGPPAEQIEGQARCLARAAGFLTRRN